MSEENKTETKPTVNNAERPANSGEQRPKNNYYRKNNYRHGYNGNYNKKPAENAENRDSEKKETVQSGAQNNQPKVQDRQFKSGGQKPNWKMQGNRQKFERKPKAEETVDDIKKDCERIEKEIELEIKEIETIKLSFE